MVLFDVKAVQEEAEKELQKEAIEKAKARLKDHARKVAAARAVVANLEREGEVLLATIGSE